MNKKRIALILSVVFVFLICLYYMNRRFNRLSRYPYDDKNATRLIDKYMSDKDIEYIIEYSIAPKYIVDFIESPRFSIYHVADYDELKTLMPELTGDEVVNAIELFIENEIDVSRGITLMQGMSPEDIITYFKTLEDE